MKIDLFQLKANDKTITCRKLPAIAVAKRISFPVNEEGAIDQDHLKNFPFAVLDCIAMTPSELEALSFAELGLLVNDPTFTAYFAEIFGGLETTTKNQ